MKSSEPVKVVGMELGSLQPFPKPGIDGVIVPCQKQRLLEPRQEVIQRRRVSATSEPPGALLGLDSLI